MRPRRSLRSGLGLSLGGVVAALLISEAALRIAGFRFATFPTVQFGWPDPVTIEHAFVPDYDLFWVTPDYYQVLADARRLHPAVIFLGDSCTQFGTYPRLTLEHLAARHSPLAHGVKLGVAGWSTEEGLTQLRRDVLPLRPRLVTIYFGWNDHWVALGLPDAEAKPRHVSWWLSQHVRLVQLVEQVRLARSVPMEQRPNRVSPERYLSNLETMARLAFEHGIIPILITAPSNHVQGHEPQPLARRTGAPLCDATAAFDELPPPRGRYFNRDGIHLSDEGNRQLAALLADCLTRAVAEIAEGAEVAERNKTQRVAEEQRD